MSCIKCIKGLKDNTRNEYLKTLSLKLLFSKQKTGETFREDSVIGGLVKLMLVEEINCDNN